MLQGKEIVLGVCGGIAAYKAAELVRLYVKAGANVSVIMTAAAQEFITPLTFQTLSGRPVHSELFSLLQEQDIGHISLADRADLLVIAPTTANLIGKLAAGIADDLLTTTVMACKAPVLLVPAMNSNMWENPICRRSVSQLKQVGYQIMDPATGMLACGWEGQGKMPEPQAILEQTQRLLMPQDLVGETVLVTAGPTREELDPMRFLSNHSSGKMGYAIARAAADRGARVHLVAGPTALATPRGVELLSVVSARDMYTAVMDLATDCSIVVKAAAVADYRPSCRQEQKIKKSGESTLTMELQRNPDILAELGRLPGERLLVGFAAETEQLMDNARRKLQDKNLDLIVANDLTAEGAGFAGDTNVVQLIYRNGRVEDLPQMSKDLLAHSLLDRILSQLSNKGKTNTQ
jgi:phosphopantothenoylcysteine decarboxylase/phosphopantothenate--cysteine ligase